MLSIPIVLKCYRKKLSLPVPTVQQYYDILSPLDESDRTEALTAILTANFEGEDIKPIITLYDVLNARGVILEWLSEQKKRPEFTVPKYTGGGKKEKVYYQSEFRDIKIVAEYTNSSFAEVFALPVLTFWRYLRDASIWYHSSTESGREYLKNAYNSNQTKADMAALAEFMTE